jgi:hypothetical protein
MRLFGIIFPNFRGVIISGSDYLGVIYGDLKGIIGSGSDFLGIIYGGLKGIIHSDFKGVVWPGFAAAVLLLSLSAMPPSHAGILYPCRST